MFQVLLPCSIVKGSAVVVVNFTDSSMSLTPKEFNFKEDTFRRYKNDIINIMKGLCGERESDSYFTKGRLER